MAVVNLQTPTNTNVVRTEYPNNAFAITASADTWDAPVAVYVGGTGNVTVTTVAGVSVTFNSVPAGTVIPVQVIAVTAATATNLVGIY